MNGIFTFHLLLLEGLKKINGISDITWLDDVVDIKQPIEYFDQGRVNDYYKDDKALFSITIEDGKERQVTDSIKQKYGDKAKLSGNAVEQADSQRLASTQTISAICVLGPLIILVLIFATTSWLEPFIYLTAIGAAVMINLGTDIFRGEICKECVRAICSRSRACCRLYRKE